MEKDIQYELHQSIASFEIARYKTHCTTITYKKILLVFVFSVKDIFELLEVGKILIHLKFMSKIPLNRIYVLLKPGRKHQLFQPKITIFNKIIFVK